MAKKATRGAAGNGTIRKKTVDKGGQSYSYWEGRLTTGYDPGTGKQRQRSFTGKTQKEVVQKMRAAAAEIDQGTYQEPSRVTVSEWLTTWLENFCVNRVKPLTIASYKAAIENYITPALGAIRRQELRGVHVQQLYNGMMNRGLSPKTVKNTAAILHKSLSVAIKQGMIPFNACDGAELPRVTTKEIKPLTDEEIPLFLEAIEQHPFRNAYALCLFAGLREGEVLGLSWAQVDFSAGKITISQQLQRERKKGGTYYLADTTKSGKPRTIAPPPIAFDYLRAEKQRQDENRLRAGSLWCHEADLVFTDEIGGHLTSVTFYKHFKAIAAHIGRPDARPHDLRHTAATVAIASGADIKSVQTLMGHATASFTINVYAHTSERMMQDTAERMQAYYDSLGRAAKSGE